MKATTNGGEIVCLWPIDQAASVYAFDLSAGSTNSCRGTLRIEASTRGLCTPARSMYSATICLRACSYSSAAHVEQGRAQKQKAARTLVSKYNNRVDISASTRHPILISLPTS